MTKIWKLALAATLAAGTALAAFEALPADAATYDGHLSLYQAPGWGGVLEGGQGTPTLGSDVISGEAFERACQADRANGGGTANIDQFLASPLNGLDGYVIDLKKEKMGAFAIKGPGAAVLVPDAGAGAVTSYDMDLDFFVDPKVDPSKTVPYGCLDANEKAQGNTSYKCWSHKSTPDEKVGCISGYTDAKGKIHGARYVMVSAGLNTVGTINFKLTTP